MSATFNINGGTNGKPKNDAEDIKIFLTSAKRNLETARRTIGDYPDVAKSELDNARRSITTAYRLIKKIDN